MCKIKKTKSERIEEILDSSKKVFLKKGFLNATMDEIVEGTSLSKGGVYHHFKNKYEIIYEIFKRGCEYRKSYIQSQQLNAQNIEGQDVFLARMIVEKILTKNEDMQLYAIFLTQMPFDEELKSMYQKLFDITEIDMAKLFPQIEFSCERKKQFAFIGNTINAYIVAAHLLGEYENICYYQETLKEMIISAINSFKK